MGARARGGEACGGGVERWGRWERGRERAKGGRGGGRGGGGGGRRVTYNALGVFLGFSLLDGHVNVRVEDLPQGLDRLHPQLCQRLCSPEPKPL
jgi:hypothetical protein